MLHGIPDWLHLGGARGSRGLFWVLFRWCRLNHLKNERMISASPVLIDNAPTVPLKVAKERKKGSPELLQMPARWKKITTPKRKAA